MTQPGFPTANGSNIPYESRRGAPQEITPPGSPEPFRNKETAPGWAPSPLEGLTSDEDRDAARPPPSVIRRRPAKSRLDTRTTSSESSTFETVPSLRTGTSVNGHAFKVDGELREIVQRGLLRAKDPAGKGKPRPKFSDLVFTRKFSTFDRQNEDAASSPFHGFYTLFWMAVFVFMVKIGADNWRKCGSPLGTNEIMKTMFRRDVVLLLLSDGIMCGITGVSWLLQRAVHAGYLDWDRSGWIIQNVRTTPPHIFNASRPLTL